MSELLLEIDSVANDREDLDFSIKESSCPYVLSVIEEFLGHKTYGNLMRNYLGSSSCKVDFYWYNEERELLTRVISRLLSYYPSNSWLRTQNVTLHMFRFQIAFAYMVRRLLLRKLKQHEHSVLHLHTQPLAYLAIDLMQKIPTVVTIDRTIAQAAREKTHPRLRWTYTPNDVLEKRVFQAAAKIVSFSETARKSVIEDYQIDENKVHVVYPGVDLSQIPQRPPAPQVSVTLPKILFVGGDFERKGGYDLLQVFLDHFSTEAELHLVTGYPVQCNHPNVHIHSNIQAYTPEWLALYHKAELFVMPTHSEPFGWVFVEAMASGLPIVATRLNAIPEIVAEGETGLLVEPGDRPALAQSIRTLLDNPTLRREMGTKGRQIAEQKFNAQYHFQTLETLFQEVAGARPPKIDAS